MQGLCCSTTGLSEQQSPTTGLLHVALSGMQVAQTDTQVYKVVRTLAVALGATRAETGTIKALHAVLMQLVRPEMGDTEAYTSTGAPPGPILRSGNGAYSCTPFRSRNRRSPRGHPRRSPLLVKYDSLVQLIPCVLGLRQIVVVCFLAAVAPLLILPRSSKRTKTCASCRQPSCGISGCRRFLTVLRCDRPRCGHCLEEHRPSWHLPAWHLLQKHTLMAPATYLSETIRDQRLSETSVTIRDFR